MISKSDYLGQWLDSPDITPQVHVNIGRLLTACNKLEAMALQDGVKFPTNPKTKSQVSGEVYGGFRPQNCTIGAPQSAHKTGEAVDRYDPDGKIDEWCSMHVPLLRTCGIYLEHPDDTPNWSHWGIRPPKSGNTIFKP